MQLTIWSCPHWPKFPSQYGIVDYQEWCELEIERINSQLSTNNSQHLAQLLNGTGPNRGFICITISGGASVPASRSDSSLFTLPS